MQSPCWFLVDADLRASSRGSQIASDTVKVVPWGVPRVIPEVRLKLRRGRVVLDIRSSPSSKSTGNGECVRQDLLPASIGARWSRQKCAKLGGLRYALGDLDTNGGAGGSLPFRRVELEGRNGKESESAEARCLKVVQAFQGVVRIHRFSGWNRYVCIWV